MTIVYAKMLCLLKLLWRANKFGVRFERKGKHNIWFDLILCELWSYLLHKVLSYLFGRSVGWLVTSKTQSHLSVNVIIKIFSSKGVYKVHGEFQTKIIKSSDHFITSSFVQLSESDNTLICAVYTLNKCILHAYAK